MHCIRIGLVAALGTVGLPGQSVVPPPQTPVFRIESSLALVPFHVVRKNHFVISLTARDIVLLEDGKAQPVALFEGGRSTPPTKPVDLLLLFDASKTNVLDRQLDPLIYKTTLLDGLPNVRLAVYSFRGGELRRFCRPMRDAAALANAMESLVRYALKPGLERSGPVPFEAIPLNLPARFKGATDGPFIYEAIAGALMEPRPEPDDATRIAVVFSQAWPAHLPGPEVGEAVALANRQGVAIDPVLNGGIDASLARRRKNQEDAIRWEEAQGYKVDVSRGGQDRLVKRALDSFVGLAEPTGGMAFQQKENSVDVVKDVLSAVAEQVRWQYVAGFKPSPSAGPPRSHKVVIRLRSKKIGEILGGERTIVH